ncbi:MAG: dockerin type I domain-containing protein [Planctomycetota bacterium]
MTRPADRLHARFAALTLGFACSINAASIGQDLAGEVVPDPFDGTATYDFHFNGPPRGQSNYFGFGFATGFWFNPFSGFNQSFVSPRYGVIPVIPINPLFPFFGCSAQGAAPSDTNQNGLWDDTDIVHVLGTSDSLTDSAMTLWVGPMAGPLDAFPLPIPPNASSTVDAVDFALWRRGNVQPPTPIDGFLFGAGTVTIPGQPTDNVIIVGDMNAYDPLDPAGHLAVLPVPVPPQFTGGVRVAVGDVNGVPVGMQLHVQLGSALGSDAGFLTLVDGAAFQLPLPPNPQTLIQPLPLPVPPPLQNVPIEIVALDLVSSQPIVVMTNQNDGSDWWMSLDISQPQPQVANFGPINIGEDFEPRPDGVVNAADYTIWHQFGVPSNANLQAFFTVIGHAPGSASDEPRVVAVDTDTGNTFHFDPNDVLVEPDMLIVELIAADEGQGFLARAETPSGTPGGIEDLTVVLYFPGENVPGDVNGDGLVTTADVTFVVSNLGAGSPGATGTPGDANGDGETTTADITFVVSNLGAGD